MAKACFPAIFVRLRAFLIAGRKHWAVMYITANRVAETSMNIIILFKSAWDSLQILAADPRFVGGRVGMLAMLHTWSQV